MAEEEQSKSEEPTPHKLKRARERGSVARGMDLGFLSVIAGFSAFAVLSGAQAVQHLSTMTARLLAETGARLQPLQTLALIQHAAASSFAIVLSCALTVAATVVLGEALQIRGLVFSMQPLKPDFSRLNPAKNLKRIISQRMLVETLKSIGKLLLYATALYLAVKDIAIPLARAPAEGMALAGVWGEAVGRLLISLALVAMIFAGLDQILARREFRKQMRMSRSELSREVKDREGEPRRKQKRKRMHAEFIEQTRALSGLRGADVLIVNPEHFAVGLKYEPNQMQAPQVVAKGRNRFAHLLKQRAFRWSILTISNPPLARALYRAGEIGAEIPPAYYQAVADMYLAVRRKSQTQANLEGRHAQS